MRKINIREALLRLDKRTDCQYDLTTLYEACDLDEKDKKKLVQYIDGYEDPASIGKFLETRCDAVCESIDDDDVSDMKLVDDINNDDDHALWELMNKFEEEDLQLKELTEDVDTGDEYEDYTSDEYCPSCGTLCDYAYDTTDNGSWVRFNCPDCGNSFDRTKVKKHTSESLTEDFNTSMLHAINLATERNERFKFDLQSFLTLNDANSIDDLSEEQLTTFYNGIKSIISKTKDNVPEDVLSAFDLTSTDALSEGARPLSKNDIIYRYNFGLPLSDKDIEKIGTVEEHQQNSRNVSEIIKGIKKIIPNCSISKKRDWTSLSLMLRTIEPITKDQQTECKEFLKQFPYPSAIYGADTYLRANGFISLSPVVADLSESLTEDVTPDEKVAIEARIREAATGILVGKLGYEEDFVDDYMIIDVDDVADNTCIKVEVRAEVDYDGLMTLGQALDPIVKEYDKKAYFEPVTSGIMSAYIRKDQSDDIPDEAAVKEWTDRFNACQTKDDVIAVYRDLIKVKDNNEVTWGTIEAIYDVIDAKMDSLGESLTEATNNSNFDLINHLKQALKGRGRLTVNDTGVRFVSLEDDFATFVSRDAFDRWLQQCVDNQISLADIDEDDIPWEHTIFIHHAYEASDYNADKRRLNQQYGFSKLSQRTNSDSSSTLSSTRINYTQLKKSNSPIVPYVERCKQLINDKYDVYRQSIKVYNPTDCAIRYAFFGNVWTGSVSSTLESLKTEFPGDITVSYRDLSDWRLSGIDVRFVMNQPLNDNPAVDESLTEDAKEEYYVGDSEGGRIYYNDKDAQAAFDSLKKSGVTDAVKMKVTDMREDVNDGWVKRWNFLDKYYKDDLVISKISSPANAWHLERVAPNGHTIEHLGNYSSLEAAKASCTKKNESKLTLNESDDTDILYDMEDWDEDNTTVTAGNSFVEDGHEWTWFKQCGDSVHLDFDNWAVWWAFRPEIDGDENSTAISGFFIVDTDTGFIDWGPCDTEKEAQEFLQSKVNDWENDDLSESKPIMEELWDRARVIDLVNYYLDRSNVTTNTLANLVMKQMKEEGSSLPSNITDFYDSLYNAIDMYNEQFDESLHSKVIKEDALDDFGVSKSDAAAISARLPKSKFYIDDNRYVFGRDLLDYFDKNEVISYSQYVNVNNVRVPDSYRIHDRTITESKSIKEGVYGLTIDTYTEFIENMYRDLEIVQSCKTFEEIAQHHNDWGVFRWSNQFKIWEDKGLDFRTAKRKAQEQIYKLIDKAMDDKKTAKSQTEEISTLIVQLEDYIKNDSRYEYISSDDNGIYFDPVGFDNINQFVVDIAKKFNLRSGMFSFGSSLTKHDAYTPETRAPLKIGMEDGRGVVSIPTIIDESKSIKEDIDSNLEAVANRLFNSLKEYGANKITKYTDVYQIYFNNSEDDSDATLVHYDIQSEGFKEVAEYGNEPNVTEYINEDGTVCAKLLIYKDSISVEVSKEDTSQYNESLKENIGVGNLVTHVDDASGTRGIVVELNDDIAKVCVGDPANNDYVEVPLDKLQLDESLKEGVEKYIIGATERGLNLYYNAKEDHMSTDMKAATQYAERAVALDDYKAVKERYPTAYIRSTYDLPLLNKSTTKVKKRENEV